MYIKPAIPGEPGRIRMSQQAYLGLEAQWEDRNHVKSEPVRVGFKYCSILASRKNIEVARKNHVIDEAEEKQARADLADVAPP